MANEFTVTPWEVKGKVDYMRLAREFGVQLITENEINTLRELTGEVHYLIRRGFFYAHRDLQSILNRQRSGLRWALYNGRGPSADLHIGHLVPWMLSKWFVDKFNVDYFFELTDDEKFLVKEGYTLEQTNKYAYENALDLIALGFTPDKLHIIIDSEDIKYLYKIAVRVGKKLTLSTVKHTFGFTDSTNVGAAFFPTLEISVAFLPTELYGEQVPVLIPTAIDQDPYFRLARDIADELGYPKPSTIYSKFIPGLTGEDKMSASNPDSAIYVTDSEKDVRRKIMNALTGGQPTAELQRKYGGDPDNCVVYKYHLLFQDSDEKVKKIYEDCRAGKLLCGECKAMLFERIREFMKEHNERRERAKDVIEQYRISVKFR
ncbi:tryptophan--tRNA ligase [Vulcanisaeta distributa]|uniref:Tryptophan--tRNA ligase n=1 Tax=Vulcanisaeta distributa (strain DSM 14429 / JCM 11212 / NBRC 100878 / IC-017) TaxID=572478 RepID=E1QTU8_VULDI|nr:tryptophan--tRNA ligase [Vulcanisaeta distributa]ADN51015.1 tryptophanyl-tRNA synthetase [Vulcanisaeta distributa DSM 14429]